MKNKLRVNNIISIILLLAVVFSFSCSRKYEDPPEDTRQQQFEQLLATYDLRFQEYLAAAQQDMGKEILRYSSLSNEKQIPKYMEISGSYYEYGYLVGHISQQFGRRVRRVSDSQAEFNNRIIEMYRQVYPQFLELARGIGDVFGIAVEELDFVYLEQDFFLNVWYNLFRYQDFQRLAGAGGAGESATATHCSMIFARVEDDIFVGRNFDQDHEKPNFVVLSSMAGGYKVLANACYATYHWVMDGINEKGLFMGTANVVQPGEYYWFDPYPDVPAICEHHLFRIALETCATVDEVIALYSSVRPWSSNGTDHLMVVDALGNSAVIEFNLDRTPSFFRADKNYQVITNTAYHEGFDYMMEHCPRFHEATERCEAGIFSFADVEEITRGVKGGGYGYTSLFDIKRGFMQVYQGTDYYTPYDFTLPVESE